MTRKSWIIFSVIVVALIGGLVFASLKNQVDVSDISQDVLTGKGDAQSTIIKAQARNGQIGDHVFGNKNAKLVLVEYGDFQCPGCGAAFPVLKALSEKYKDQIAFVFRNYPLVTLHPNALAAATAAETAGQMGKYWEMHDLLYQNQNSWNTLSASNRTDMFVSYAEQLGLKGSEFRSKYGNDQVNAKISFDRALGSKVGVSGTPTIYLGGQYINQQVTADGTKLVTTYDSNLSYVWSNQEAMDKLIVQPALKARNIELPQN